jgi:hypothetical protein
MCNQPRIHVGNLARRTSRVEVQLDVPAPGPALRVAAPAIAQPQLELAGESAGGAAGHHRAGGNRDRVGRAIDRGGDNASTPGHGLEQHERHPVPPRRNGHDVGRRQPLIDVVAFTDEGDRTDR